MQLSQLPQERSSTSPKYPSRNCRRHPSLFGVPAHHLDAGLLHPVVSLGHAVYEVQGLLHRCAGYPDTLRGRRQDTGLLEEVHRVGDLASRRVDLFAPTREPDAALGVTQGLEDATDDLVVGPARGEEPLQ